MSEYSNLGKYLKSKRVDCDFTQSELAEKLGDVHSQFISNWERGLCSPPAHSFQRLVEVLKLNKTKLAAAMLEDSRLIIASKVFGKKSSAKKIV